MPRLRLPLLTLVALPVLAGTARARPAPRVEVHRSATPAGGGVQHLPFRFGPVRIRPGQYTIAFAVTNRRPKVDGYVTSFRPNLVRANGTVPPVDVVHPHHAVRLVGRRAIRHTITGCRLPCRPSTGIAGAFRVKG